jgi:hypothetical protein
MGAERKPPSAEMSPVTHLIWNALRSLGARRRTSASQRTRSGSVCAHDLPVLQVADVDAEHERPAAAGVAITEPPTDMPRGLREMQAADPRGACYASSKSPKDILYAGGSNEPRRCPAIRPARPRIPISRPGVDAPRFFADCGSYRRGATPRWMGETRGVRRLRKRKAQLIVDRAQGRRSGRPGFGTR